MENISLALCAHVDAGKTTLSEAMLFETGAIRKKGRVDHGDAFLDTDPIERERGITIFSKLAIMEIASSSARRSRCRGIRGRYGAFCAASAFRPSYS